MAYCFFMRFNAFAINTLIKKWTRYFPIFRHPESDFLWSFSFLYLCKPGSDLSKLRKQSANSNDQNHHNWKDCGISCVMSVCLCVCVHWR